MENLSTTASVSPRSFSALKSLPFVGWVGSAGEPEVRLRYEVPRQQQQHQWTSSQVLEELDKKSPTAKHSRPMKMTARSHAASELPLEELLALYGYEVLDPLLQSDKDTCQLAASLPDMTLDKDQITKDLFPGEEEEEESSSSADDLTPSVTSNTSELLRRLQGGDKGMLASSSEEESDDDSDASDASTDGRKDIMVGSMYQAKIPPISPYTYQDRARDGEDQLLWSPGVLPVHEVEEYLLCAQTPGCQEGAASTRLPGDTIRDNEQALYELVKCNFNAEEALRRIHFNVKVFSEELCAWSEQECRNFEHGYRVYGKNFHLIQANKVRTRSVGEVVEYYYMWKKSDRHEYFTQQATQRLSRRKYNLQSGNMEDGDQDGEVGELVGGGNSQDSSQGTLGAAQPESPSLPPPGLELDKQGGQGMEMSELYAGGCPQQLFRCPFSLLSPVEDPQEPGPGSCSLSNSQLQAQPSPCSSLQPCGSPPSPAEDHHILGSGFYQLQLYGPFIPEGPDCGTAGSGNGLPHGLQMDFSLPPASPPSPAILPSDFGGYGAILCSSPIQRPHSLTQ